MARTLVWDLPTRLFHWTFAFGFAIAAVIALGLGDDSPAFPLHALIGLVLGMAIALRVMWGLVGSRHARFASFAFGPRAVLGYFRAIVRGKGERHAGHNPGAAHGIFAMLALVSLLVATGIAMSFGADAAEDVHEVLAYLMIAAVLAHLAGIAVHTVMHRENIAASMVHGRKDCEASDGIASPHLLAGAVFVVIVAAWAAALWSNYDHASATTRLPIVGTTISLGEHGETAGVDRGERDDRRGRRGRARDDD
jgi:cytochrome b